MGDVTVRDYSDADSALWDGFVRRSKNGTFLFERDYMEYHADRFPDASLVVLGEEGNVRALLPATRKGSELVSHPGLTYGGFIVDERMSVEVMLKVFEASLGYLRARGVTTLVYKTMPHIYHQAPAHEDLYALFVNGAELFRRDVLSVIDYRTDVEPTARRCRGLKKAARAGLEVRGAVEYERFWPLLTSNLKRRHALRPVHSLAEIELLARRFPTRIQLFGVYQDTELIAGAVVYLSHNVCHVQYNASSDVGRKLAAQDLLFAHLIDAFRDTVRYFDFGVSTEQNGRFLNAGLVGYKEEFGARTVAHDFYRVAL